MNKLDVLESLTRELSDTISQLKNQEKDRKPIITSTTIEELRKSVDNIKVSER
jgi:hypothetical protein